MTTVTLHTVNKSPFKNKHLADCLDTASAPQAIILLEDGVYGALTHAPEANRLNSFIQSGGKVFALESDLIARGIQRQCSDAIETIDYTEFVNLCTQYNPIQSWY